MFGHRVTAVYQRGTGTVAHVRNAPTSTIAHAASAEGLDSLAAPMVRQFSRPYKATPARLDLALHTTRHRGCYQIHYALAMRTT